MMLEKWFYSTFFFSDNLNDNITKEDTAVIVESHIPSSVEEIVENSAIDNLAVEDNLVIDDLTVDEAVENLSADDLATSRHHIQFK